MTSPSPQHSQAIEDFSRNFAAKARLERGLSPDSKYVRTCIEYAERLLSAGLPVIFNKAHLSRLVGYSVYYLDGASRSPQKFYRNFEIAKHDGGRREISEPLPSLKEVQRWIYQNILLNVDVSVAAKAYVPGRKLKESARLHRAQNFVLRIDIKNFFPSITQNRVFGLFRSFGYCSDVAGILSRLCCLNESLPQGGPCSPYLSNIILRSLDDRLFSFCRMKGLRYSRYADDFTFSGENFTHSLVEFIYSVIKSEGFDINEKKTVIMRRGSRQSVVGVVVNSKINARRDFRRKLRQQHYYINKHGLDSHLQRVGEKRSGAVAHYLGKCAFVLSLNSEDRDALAFSELLRGS